MSERSLVECPVCEEEFDPTAAGGWCTNSECGEWRHDGADLPTGDDAGADDADESAADAAVGDAAATDSETEAVDGGADDVTADPTPAIQRVSGDADAAETASDSVPEDTESDDDDGVEGGGATDEAGAVDDEAVEEDGATPEADDAVEVEDDAATEADAAVEAGDAAVERGDAEPADDAEADDAAPADDTEAEVTCPGCSETVDADVNFCPSCGTDVSTVNPGDEDDELTECPGCGDDVGPEASFCPSCGENLDAHREADELTACPSCGDEVDPSDSFCVSCGEDLDAHREGGAEQETDSEPETETADAAGDGTAEESDAPPERLLLRTRGEELTVEDGDTVGRELRRIVTETGGDEDDAVRIHREHVRFVREDDQFYLVDLGRNPTKLGDTRLEQGDREPVGPGDELSLSGVVSLAVDEP